MRMLKSIKLGDNNERVFAALDKRHVPRGIYGLTCSSPGLTGSEINQSELSICQKVYHFQSGTKEAIAST